MTIPQYRALAIVAGFIDVAGAVCVAAPLAVILAPAVDKPDYNPAPAFVFSVIGSGLIAALLMFAVANVLRAIRDMAINSWHQRQAVENLDERDRSRRAPVVKSPQPQPAAPAAEALEQMG